MISYRQHVKKMIKENPRLKKMIQEEYRKFKKRMKEPIIIPADPKSKRLKEAIDRMMKEYGRTFRDLGRWNKDCNCDKCQRKNSKA